MNFMKGGKMPEKETTMRRHDIKSLASNILNSEAAAENWINTPNGALNGLAPHILLETDQGAQRVKDILMRIKYSNYS